MSHVKTALGVIVKLLLIVIFGFPFFWMLSMTFFVWMVQNFILAS